MDYIFSLDPTPCDDASKIQCYLADSHIFSGKNLAMLAIKFVLAKLILAHKLDTFEYLPQSRVELQANPGLLKLKTGLRCRASPV